MRANNRFRILLDTNRYSVPGLFASQRLVLKSFADRLCIYHDQKLIATHIRSYDRHRDFEDPDHVKDLLVQRRQARNAKLLLSFYALCPRAQEYHRQLQERRLNARIHIAKIMALSEVYGPDKVARAIEDAFEFAAFSSDYIANILEQRERLTLQPGPLHLTRHQDLLDVELAPVDISISDPGDTDSTSPKHDQNPADTALEKHLDHLKLPFLKENRRPFAAEGNTKHWSHIDYLARLIEVKPPRVKTAPFFVGSRPLVFPSLKPLRPSAGIGKKGSISSRSRISSGCASSTKKPMPSS